MYSALMIDLKKSRSYSIDSRNIIQHQLIYTCDKLNAVFSKSIIKKVEFSGGDEVQGLFCEPSAAYLYFRLFEVLVYPIKIRAGIGLGKWDVKINNVGSTAQDGEVYHNARRAIDNVDNIEDCSVLFYSGNPEDIYINSLICSASTITNNLTKTQQVLAYCTELLSPIVSKKTMDINLVSQILFNHLDNDFANILSDTDKNHILFRINCNIIRPIIVEDIKDVFYVNSGKQRGLPQKISLLLSKSRQSIDKSLKDGNIYTARNLSLTAIKTFEKIEGEYLDA